MTIQKYGQDFEFEPSSIIKRNDGPYYLVIDVDAALAEKEEDWQLKYDLLTQDYEQKWGLANRLQEQIALLNPCGHSPAESIVCNICGYPDPRKIIASLTENFEAGSRTVGLQAEEIERLNLALSYKVKAVFLQGRKDVLKEGIEEGYDCPIHGKQETGDCPRC